MICILSLIRPETSGNFRLTCVSGTATGLVVIVHSRTVWMNPHYLAPLVPILWCWIGVGLSWVSNWKIRGFELGLFLSIACLGCAVVEYYDEFEFGRDVVSRSDSWHLKRHAMEERLKATDGLHLVLIEYGPSHSPHNEWCYNSADIDGSKVVWARDLGEGKNSALLEYFANRFVYRLHVDQGEPQICGVEAE
jgi:hypothetical protein